MSERKSTSERSSRLMRTNTSGYRGVSWHKAARKWGAKIRVDGVSRHLGLFDTPESANTAYLHAEAELRGNADAFDPQAELESLLSIVRGLYRKFEIKALSTTFLEKQPAKLYHRLL